MTATEWRGKLDEQPEDLPVDEVTPRRREARALLGSLLRPFQVTVGLLALAAAWRHPPFYLALTGLVILVFGGVSVGFGGAVLPAAGPAWAARLLVMVSAGLGAALLATGIVRLRFSARLAPVAGLSSSA